MRTLRMQPDHYDVLVLGAGPAGSAAAYHASRQGARVLLVDRLDFPRPKTCGDALSPRALAAIWRLGIAETPGHPVRGVRIRHGSSGREHFEDFADHAPPHTGRVVERRLLDHLLLERALAAGAEFRVADAHELLSRDGRIRGASLRTATASRALFAGTVVGAVGAGAEAALAGTSAETRPFWGVAGRQYLRTPVPVGDELEFYFPLVHGGEILFGYAWVFPEGADLLNVGIGLVRTEASRSAPLRDLLQAFLASRAPLDERLRLAAPCGSLASAPIPVGTRIGSRPGFIPIGDAAHLAYPLTAEGIATAIESGEIAAGAIVSAGEDAAVAYAERLAARMPRHLGLQPALRDMYEHPWFFFDRCWDVLAPPQGTTGRAVRNLVWDEAPAPPAWRTLSDVRIRAAVEAVEADVLADGRRLRPLLAELLRYVTADPSTQFGWFAAWGAAARATVAPEAPDLPADARRILSVLEIINLVGALHRDLPRAATSADSSRAWGRQTLSLILADVLTARALQVLHGLPADPARRIAESAGAALRDQASRPPADDAGSRAIADLFDAAARAATGTVDGDPPPSLRAVARYLAATLEALLRIPPGPAAGNGNGEVVRAQPADGTYAGRAVVHRSLRADAALGGRLERVEEIIAAIAGKGSGAPAAFYEQLRSPGSKRVRSTLLLLAASGSGAPDRCLVRAAAGIELLHEATLYHDDIVDEATVRRGRPSVQAAHGPQVAALAGSALLYESVALFADLPLPLRRSVGRACEALCRGQLREIEYLGHLSLSPRHRVRVMRDKTARLFELAAGIGSALAGVGDSDRRALRRFGRRFGLVFQLSDDIRDLVGSPADLGRAPRGDLRDGVYTLPVLHALQHAGSEAAELRTLLSAASRPRPPEMLERAAHLTHAAGGIEASLRTMRGWLAAARHALGSIDGAFSAAALDGFRTLLETVERDAASRSIDAARTMSDPGRLPRAPQPPAPPLS